MVLVDTTPPVPVAVGVAHGGPSVSQRSKEILVVSGVQDLKGKNE